MSEINISTGHPDAGRVYADAYEQVKAERDALQQLLNASDQQVDDAATENNERELSRRSWFDEAQRLQADLTSANADKEAYAQNAIDLRAELDRLGKRYNCLANDQLELVKELDDQRAHLAERDALLEDWHAANATGEVKVSDKAYRIVTRTAAALSASAEPNGGTCIDNDPCGGPAGHCRWCKHSAPPVERDERAPCQHPNVVPRSQITDGKFLGYFCKNCESWLGTDRAALEVKP